VSPLRLTRIIAKRLSCIYVILNKTANSLTIASLIALLAATPTSVFSASTVCTPSDPVALRACFHSAEFNVVDSLSVYGQDLSAYGTPRPPSSLSEEAPVAVKSNLAQAPALDAATLRAFFHSVAFNTSDGLNPYDGD
jgi:hypothetical protein